MSTNKNKLRKAEPATGNADIYLSPADHVATVLADKDAAVAAAEVERDAARLQSFRLQTQMQVQQAEAALKEKRTHAQAMHVARRDLAAEIAQRYAINWQTHAIEPLTGQLVEVPKD